MPVVYQSEDVQREVVALIPLLVGPVAMVVVDATKPVTIFLATVIVAVERTLNLWYDPLVARVKIPAIIELLVVRARARGLRWHIGPVHVVVNISGLGQSLQAQECQNEESGLYASGEHFRTPPCGLIDA